MRHPLEPIIQMIDEQTTAVGRARANFFAKKAMKRNLEARLVKGAQGSTAKEREMNAFATEEWLNFETELNRLEAIYDFQRDKLEVLNKEYQAQYLELKDNASVIRKSSA
jgi:DNA-binding transcriptional regulator GbsR (MarR family)